MFRGPSTPPLRVLAVLVCAAVLGLGGLLPGAAGAADPVALLGWLALSGAALGAMAGSTRVGFFPFAVAIPAVWAMALVAAQVGAARPLPGAPWALCLVTGLFGAGFAFGRRSEASLGGAGQLLLLALAAAGASVGYGLVAGGAELARSHPSGAAWLVELSPLVWVFDCAGWDWTHAQDEVYRQAGVEWFPRQSFSGSLAGPAVLVVGCLLALLVRPRSEATEAPQWPCASTSARSPRS